MSLQTLPAPLTPDRTAGLPVVHGPGATRAALTVDAEIRALVVSDAELARSHVQVTDAPDRTGFEVLSAAPDGVVGAMGDLRRAFAPGVDEILSSLDSIQDSIAELLKIARTPDQTWALEQFSIAHTAFGRGLIDEALTYINRAIEGDGVRSGFPLDHRFYVFRGLLRVGDIQGEAPDSPDLEVATEDFLLAARYAERVDDTDRARALGLAGWTALRRGDPAAAETHLRAALAINPHDILGAFDLAKVLLRRGARDEGLIWFDKALRADAKYALRAGADPDFLPYKTDITRLIKAVRKAIHYEVQIFVNEYNALGVDRKQAILERYGLKLDAAAHSFFEITKRWLDHAPLLDLQNTLASAPRHLDTLRDEIRTARGRILRSVHANTKSYMIMKNKAQKSEEIRKNASVLSIFGILFSLFSIPYTQNWLPVVILIASTSVFITLLFMRFESDKANAPFENEQIARMRADLSEL